MTDTGTDSVRPLRWPSGISPVRFRRFSLRVEVRAAVWTAVFALAAVAVAVWAMTLGTGDIGLDGVWSALTGDATPGVRRIVIEWRLPRVVFALLAGAALAVSGAVFQSITRNPLGSPDIIGFSSGAYTGALLVAVLAAPGAWATSIGALVGGMLAGVAVYLLAYKQGIAASRIIVVGIGVSLFLGAFNTWLLTTMRLEQAISAASWGAGALVDIGWAHTIPVIAGVAICLPIVMWLAADMRMLEMGDDAGRAVGVPAERVRLVMLLLGIVLVALVTASAGPIAFVALAAPQLAMRVTGTAGVRIIPAAVFGSLLLIFSDVIAQIVIAPKELPVGVVTLCLGGGYLVWLLATSGRRSRP